MKGSVLNYDPRSGTGLISGNDDQRYTFSGTDVQSDFNALSIGAIVDFTPENNIAKSIFMVEPPRSGGLNINLGEGARGGKSRIVAALLALFLGTLGIHKFYLGYNKAGVIMLVISLGGWILFGIPTMIIGFIAFIECIIYLMKSDDEFYNTYVAHQKEWF